MFAFMATPLQVAKGIFTHNRVGKLGKGRNGRAATSTPIRKRNRSRSLQYHIFNGQRVHTTHTHSFYYISRSRLLTSNVHDLVYIQQGLQIPITTYTTFPNYRSALLVVYTLASHRVYNTLLSCTQFAVQIYWPLALRTARKYYTVIIYLLIPRCFVKT
jgi:hypothetical protein